MNKAFVREADAGLDADQDEDELDPSLQVPAGSKNYMTPNGYRQLAEELDELLKRERPRVVEVVRWAASNGDRSENGDYIYGKRRLREIDRRIRFINRRLAFSQVVDPLTPVDREQVFFGATVTLWSEGSTAGNEEQTYSIVGIDEADAGRGRISWTSPLARALLKARTGDLVRFQSPAGLRQVEVIEINYIAID